MYRWILVLAFVCSGCLGSESHWGDDNNNSKNTNAATNNATTGNNTATNNGNINNGVDAGTNEDAGVVDGGTPDECVAYRQRDDLSLARARCYQADPTGFECTCFDTAMPVLSTAATCDEALINDCGAVQDLLVDEIETCTVANRNAGSFTGACVRVDGGWNCACDLASNPVFSEELDCFDAAWEACYSQTPTDCTAGNDSCTNSGPYTYDCSCETYGDRAVEAPFCDDALEACAADVAIDGCTSAAGYCDRDDEFRRFDCTCLDGSTSQAPYGDACADILAAECP